MDSKIKTGVAILLTVLTIASCSSAPSSHDPYNSPDSQRSRAGQAQDEMSK
jgi:hypothetical protein